MIQAKELRIGNWVNAPRYVRDNCCETSQLNDIVPYQIVFLSKNMGHEMLLTPLRLTNEILKSAGFKNGIKTIKTSFLETELYVDLMDGDAGFNKHGLWFPCKHLHQLQNLYYCFTGEELDIDLNKLNKQL